MAANRRRHRRTRKRIQVAFGDVDLAHRGTVLDVSSSGLFVAARKIFPLDTRLHLHVLEPRADFYAEAVVARLRKVEPALRQLESEGMGLRLLTPEELMGSVAPAVEHARHAHELVCGSIDDLERVIRDELGVGVLLVPFSGPAPAVHAPIEFTIRLVFGATNFALAGRGRVLQILPGRDGVSKLVVEVPEAAELVGQLLDGAG